MRNKSVFLAVYTENAKLPAGKINRFASIRNKEFVLLVASWYFFFIIFFFIGPWLQLHTFRGPLRVLLDIRVPSKSPCFTKTP